MKYVRWKVDGAGWGGKDILKEKDEKKMLEI